MTDFKHIKLLLMDVDGCMTDGTIYYGNNGEELKRFCIYDGMGCVLLRQAGIPCGIITSEQIPLVERRARKLQLDYLYQGAGSKQGKDYTLRYIPAAAEPEKVPPMTKLEAAREICRMMHISLAEVCFIGDDVNDLDLLLSVGHPVCPANASPQVKAIPNIRILTQRGGEGAIRFITDEIIRGLKI